MRKILNIHNINKGAQGALFGLAVTGSKISNTKIYFNDDNDNNVQVLERSVEAFATRDRLDRATS